MNIVVTNDDVLHTPGIWLLAEGALPYGHASVVAPDQEQSEVGVGVTLQHPLPVVRLERGTLSVVVDLPSTRLFNP